MRCVNGLGIYGEYAKLSIWKPMPRETSIKISVLTFKISCLHVNFLLLLLTKKGQNWKKKKLPNSNKKHIFIIVR